MRPFPIVVFGEAFGRCGTDFIVIIVPRPGPFGSPLPLVFMRIDRNAVPRPSPEAGLEPLERRVAKALALDHRRAPAIESTFLMPSRPASSAFTSLIG